MTGKSKLTPADLLQILSTKSRPATREDVAAVVKLSVQTVGRVLRDLRESNAILFRQVSGRSYFAHPESPAAPSFNASRDDFLACIGHTKARTEEPKGAVVPPRYVNVWTAPMRGYDAAIAQQMAARIGARS